MAVASSCVLGNCVVDARVKSSCVENGESSCLTTVWKMTAVVDTQSQEQPANLTADELKASLGAGSAGDSNLGTQRSHVSVCIN